MKEIRGILPPLTAPLVSDKISINRLHKNLEIFARQELGGYVLLGSNGEAVLLHEIEKEQMIKAARLVVPDDRILIVGTGMETVNQTVRMTRIAADNGADFALVITPFYYKKAMTDEALIAYFTAVAEKTKLPILIYNVPATTGITISIAAVRELAKLDRIVGIKDSSGDLPYLLNLCAQLPRDFQILCGNASIFASALLAGARGGILGIANALPEPFIQIWRHVQAGEIEAAMTLQKNMMHAVRATIGEHGVAGVKAAMDLRGLYGGPPRLPLLPCSKETVQDMRTVIEDLVAQGIIPGVQLGK
jgi:4-hydroxy-2-oxoglutarate aldolase